MSEPRRDSGAYMYSTNHICADVSSHASKPQVEYSPTTEDAEKDCYVIQSDIPYRILC